MNGRVFITDAIMNGLPPHVAQVIAGHDDNNTTMRVRVPSVVAGRDV
ncbi:hypothetical protein [Embleya sp. NPDC059237]